MRVNVRRSAAALSGAALLCLSASPAFADVSGTLLPTAEGNYLQWTPKTGSTHYTMVDESSCNGTTDYNRTTTLNQRDSYVVTVSSIPDGSKITQIDITPCASRNTTGGSSTMNVFYRLNGVNSADAGGYALPNSTTPSTLATTSFTGLTTNKSSSTTLEVGAVYSAGTKGVRLSRIAAVVTYTTLAAPSGLSATPTGTDIGLNWTDNSSIEDGFKLERSTDGVNFTEFKTVGAGVTSHTMTGATTDTTYTFKVRAYNSGGNSSYSGTASASTVPNAPSGLSATPTGTSIALNWTDTSAVESGFKLERSTDGVNFTEFKTVGAGVTSHTMTGGTVDTTYTFKVRAYNATGNSSYSSTASASTTPNAPSGLAGFAIGSTVDLMWTDGSAVESGFKLERSTDGGAFTQIKTYGANVTTTTDTGTTLNHEYQYRIRSYNAAGNSSYSNTASVHTYDSFPADPTGLTVTLLSGSVLSLNWTDNATNEKNYVVERKTGTGSFSVIATLGKDVTTKLDGPLSSGTYTYRVKATNPYGSSFYTNQQTGIVP